MPAVAKFWKITKSRRLRISWKNVFDGEIDTGVDPAWFTCPCLPRKAENSGIVSHPLYFCLRNTPLKGIIVSETHVTACYDGQPKVIVQECLSALALVP